MEDLCTSQSIKDRIAIAPEDYVFSPTLPQTLIFNSSGEHKENIKNYAFYYTELYRIPLYHHHFELRTRRIPLCVPYCTIHHTSRIDNNFSSWTVSKGKSLIESSSDIRSTSTSSRRRDIFLKNPAIYADREKFIGGFN